MAAGKGVHLGHVADYIDQYNKTMKLVVLLCVLSPTHHSSAT